MGSEKDDLVAAFPTVAFEALVPGWSLLPLAADCKCEDTKECDPCVQSRTKEIGKLLSTLPPASIIVAHSDILKLVFGCDAKNAEIKEIILS
jgi:hypothetical protein